MCGAGGWSIDNVFSWHLLLFLGVCCYCFWHVWPQMPNTNPNECSNKNNTCPNKRPPGVQPRRRLFKNDARNTKHFWMSTHVFKRKQQSSTINKHQQQSTNINKHQRTNKLNSTQPSNTQQSINNINNIQQTTSKHLRTSAPVRKQQQQRIINTSTQHNNNQQL